MAPSSQDHMTALEDVPKLSKNQKKRRKRKVAKDGSVSSNNSKNEADTKDDAELAPVGTAAAVKVSNSTLNPSAQVHARLVKEGYTGEEVTVAMGEMWDKEMTGYDEFDAVLAYLRGAHKEVDTASTAPSTTMDEPSLNGHHHEETVEEEKEEDASISTSSSQHLDIAARLDMVVSESEDLGDSAFALNKWILEMAKQSELEDFCLGNKTRALFTVVRRTVEDPSDSSLPAVLTMINSVFLKAGMDSQSAAETKGSLRLVLQQARTAYVKNKHDMLAENICNAIVTRISGLVLELLSKESDDASKSIRQLEKEIESLSVTLNSLGQAGIQQLVINRDIQKQAVEKASKVVNLSMGAIPNGQAATAQVSCVTKDEVLLSLVGTDGFEKMNANKIAHDAVRQKMKDAEERTSPEYQALKMNLSSFQGERSIVTDKIEELKNALKQLEEEDAMLCQKIEGTEKEIAILDESSSGEIAVLQKELAKTSKEVESDVSIRTLADRLAVYETSVKQSVNVSSAGKEHEGMEVVAEKMNLYLIRARNYFRSEADCVQFLRSRVRALELETSSLNNELEEFKSLGLMTNARQVEHSLQRKVDNVKEDNNIIARMCAEATETREQVADKLEKFTMSAVGLSSLHMTALRGIVSAMNELEVDIGRLAKFVGFPSNGNTSKPPAVSQAQAPNGVRAAGKPNGKSAVVDAPPAQLAPKLTWATKTESVTKTRQAKSLLNIQKEEELSSKN